MNTAILQVTPIELAYIDRLVRKEIQKLKESKSEYSKEYLKQVKILEQKIQDSIISF